MNSRRIGYSGYEFSILAVSALVGLSTGIAVTLGTTARTTGGGLGTSLRIAWTFAIPIVLCLAPAADQVIRRTSTGRTWKDLQEPYRSSFRQMVARHLAYIWCFAALSAVVLALNFVDVLALVVALVLLGLLLLAILVASVVIRQRLKTIWRDSGLKVE